MTPPFSSPLPAVQRYSLGSVLTPGNRVRLTDIQVRGCARLQLNCDFPPEGAADVRVINLNYSAAS